jgi:hypothetical protein
VKEHDLNKSFVLMAGPIMLGGLIWSLNSGIAGLFISSFVCYFMLVAVNAIKRGENSKKRK